MNYFDAIYKLYPQVVRTCDEKAFDKDGNEVVIDKNAIEAEVMKTLYQRQRAAAYPSFADQFDLLYHGGYEAWKAAIDEVKTRYPKP